MARNLRTLRVGVIIDRWQPSRGGAERALSLLVRHLEARGHAAHVFAKRGPRGEESAPGRLHRVGRWLALSRGARENAFGRAAQAAASEMGCDVTVGVRHLRKVDLYWPHGGSHQRSVTAWNEARAWPRIVPSGRAARLTGRHAAFVELERALLQDEGARRVACVSHAVARELGEDFPASRDRLTVVENGVDLDSFHPRERAQRGAGLRRELSVGSDVLLAFAARQPVLKGLPVLLAALARLQGLKWTLVVAGARDARGWEERASREGVEPGRLRIVREAESVALFSAADLCVLPTWRDTSGLVVLEALACGTPVVTTARAGAADVVSRDAGAVVANAGDVEGLASALATWIGRIEGGVDREAVRACVQGRGLPAWMERLEKLLVELAG